MSRNIFVKKQTKCPVCQTHYELKYPNPKLYAASRRDDDERVTEYSWTLGIKTTVLPHHYSVLQCPNCLYADFTEKLEKPGYGSKERGIYKALNDLPADRKLMLRRLRRIVPEESDYNLETAFALHLAAIYINLLPTEPQAIDHLALGRLYLRLSWLYREKGGDGVAASTAAQAATPVKKSSIISRLSAHGEKLEETIQESLDLLTEFRDLSKKRTQELELPPEKNPYAQTVNEIENYIEMAFQDLSKLESIVVQDRNRILTLKEKAKEEEKTATAENDKPPTLAELIPALVAIWPQLPQDEASAVRLAAEAFDYSFKHEEVSQNIQQSNAIGNVMLQLLQKTGDLDRALEYAVQLYKTAFRDKQSLQMTLNQGQKDNSMKDEEVKEMNRMLAAVTNALNKSGESRKRLLEQIYQRDKAKITQVLKAKVAASPQEQIQALVQAGINEELAGYLKDRQIIKTDNQKKKWFSK